MSTVHEAVSLTEAQFDDTTRQIVAKVLQAGWSRNGNYYSRQVAESLAPALTESRKVFLDHRMDEHTRKYGRSLRDWGATIKEAWAENGATFVRLQLTENGESKWLYDEAKAHPEEVGLSINAPKARVLVDGEAEGRKGRIIEEIGKAGCDFVASPSAGGQVMHILQSYGELDEAHQGEYPMSLSDTRKAIEDKKKHREMESELFDLWDAFKQTMASIHDPDNPASEEEKRTAHDRVIDDLKTELSRMDFANLVGMMRLYASCGMDTDLLAGVLEVQEDMAAIPSDAVPAVLIELNEAETEFSDKPWSEVNKADLPASAFLIVGDPDVKGTWHLPYRDETGKVNKGALRALSVIIKSGQFRGQKLSFSIPEKVRKRIDALLKVAQIGEFAEEGVQPTSTEGSDKMTIEEVQAKIAEALSPLTGQIGELSEKMKVVETLAETVKGIRASLDQMTVKEAVREVREGVEVKLKASKIAPAYLTEAFMDQLMIAPNDEARDDLIRDREDLIARAAPRILGVGPRNGGAPAPTLPKTAEDRLAALTGVR